MAKQASTQALVVEVSLSRKGESPTRHIARDVGLAGILLQAGAHNGLSPGTPVEVMFTAGRVIGARVVSVNAGVIALIYDQLNADDVAFLNELLQSRETHTELARSVASV